MNVFFLAMAGLMATVNTLAVARGLRRLEWIAKPAVIVALIAYTAAGLQSGLAWLFAGLLFSLVGDVILLSKDRFVLGLGAFLLAHIAYTIGLSPLPPFKIQHLIVAALIIVLVSLPAVQVYRRIAAGLHTSGNAGLKGPILVYMTALCLMAISALFTMLRGSWLPMNSLAVVAGALLFMLSDTLLAWNRFVAPLPNAKVWVMVSYHLAQILITIGAVAQFAAGPPS